MPRLITREERGSHGGLIPSTVTPSTSSISTAGPSTSARRGSTETLSDSARQSRSIRSSSPSSISRAENTTRDTACRSATCSSCSSVPSVGTRPILLFRRCVGRRKGTDYVEPVFRVSGELADECLSHLARPDQQRVLDADHPPRDRSNGEPSDRHQDDHIDAEQQDLGEVESPHRRVTGVDPKDQATDHGRVEEPWKVVDGRVADPLDVAVVEAVELEQHHGQRDWRRRPTESGARAAGRSGTTRAMVRASITASASPPARSRLRAESLPTPRGRAGRPACSTRNPSGSATRREVSAAPITRPVT